MTWGGNAIILNLRKIKKATWDKNSHLRIIFRPTTPKQFLQNVRNTLFDNLINNTFNSSVFQLYSSAEQLIHDIMTQVWNAGKMHPASPVGKERELQAQFKRQNWDLGRR